MAHILLVEDNPGALAATSLVLKNAGHRVTTATSVAEAAACTRTNPDLDLVITDYRLSGADDHAAEAAFDADSPSLSTLNTWLSSSVGW